MADILAEVVGRPVTVRPPPERTEVDEERVRMRSWLSTSAWRADIGALRKLLPLKDLSTWLRLTGWENAGQSFAPSA
jgi:hypothetical protein